MSDIKVGDLVVVVNSVCEHGDKDIGRIFQVPELVHDYSHCMVCFLEMPKQWIARDPRYLKAGFLLQHLKRIPPLDELERDEIVKELTA